MLDFEHTYQYDNIMITQRNPIVKGKNKTMDEKNLITEKQLSTFPIKEIRIGTKTQKVRFDESTNRMYLLDENGAYTGKSTIWTKPDVKQKDVPEEQDCDEDLNALPLTIEIPAPKEPAEQIENNIPQETPPKEPSEPKKKKRKLLLGAFLGVVLLVLSAIIFGVIKRATEQETKPTGEASAQTTESTSPTTDTNTGDPTVVTDDDTTAPTDNSIITIPLLAPKEGIMPGQSIKEVELTIVEVPENKYKLLSAIAMVYTDADKDRLSDMVAAKYIAAGKYLMQGDLTSKYTPVNPWEDVAPGEACVTIPVTVENDKLADYLWGNQINIKITYETSYGTPTAPGAGNSQTPDGVLTDSTLVESTLVTTYLFRSAVICDVYNKEGNSLYPEYEKRTLLPDDVLEKYLDDRFADKDTVSNDTPCSIFVVLTQEQFDMFSALDIEAMTIEVEKVAASCETTLQRDVYTKLQEVGQAVIRRLAEPQKEEA